MIHTIATQPDSSHPLNPANYDYTDRGPEFCAYCGVADPEHLTNIGSAVGVWMSSGRCGS